MAFGDASKIVAVQGEKEQVAPPLRQGIEITGSKK
jgi:hypothetical protein